MTKVTEAIFDAPPLAGTVRELADHMPVGKAWEAKLVENSNLHTLVYGLATPFNFFEKKAEELVREFDIDQTVQLIGEWEKSVGLPDPCLGALSDIVQRRELVKQRLRRLPKVTLQDHQTMVDEGVPETPAVLVPGAEFFGGFEYEFEMQFAAGFNSRFILVVLVESTGQGFEYEWEMEFEGQAEFNKLFCILRRVVPANVYILFQEVDSATLLFCKQKMASDYGIEYLW